MDIKGGNRAGGQLRERPVAFAGACRTCLGGLSDTQRFPELASPFAIPDWEKLPPIDSNIAVSLQFSEKIKEAPDVVRRKKEAPDGAFDTVEVEGKGAATLSIRHSDPQQETHGYVGRLKQFHMHFPAEHKIAGKKAAGELHLVFADENGHMAVAAFQIMQGEQDNPALAHIINQLEGQGEVGTNLLMRHITKMARQLRPVRHQETISFVDLLEQRKQPQTHEFAYTLGGLTTPTEDGTYKDGEVRWLIFKDLIHASAEQIEDLHIKTLGHDNNRALQTPDLTVDGGSRPIFRGRANIAFEPEQIRGRAVA